MRFVRILAIALNGPVAAFWTERRGDINAGNSNATVTNATFKFIHNTIGFWRAKSRRSVPRDPECLFSGCAPHWSNFTVDSTPSRSGGPRFESQLQDCVLNEALSWIPSMSPETGLFIITDIRAVTFAAQFQRSSLQLLVDMFHEERWLCSDSAVQLLLCRTSGQDWAVPGCAVVCSVTAAVPHEVAKLSETVTSQLSCQL